MLNLVKTWLVGKPQPVNGLGRRRLSCKIVCSSLLEADIDKWLGQNGNTFNDLDGTVNRYLKFNLHLRGENHVGCGLRVPVATKKGK